jgi:hypothetical protein
MDVPLFNLCRGYPAHAKPSRLDVSPDAEKRWRGRSLDRKGRQVYANQSISVIIVADNPFFNLEQVK